MILNFLFSYWLSHRITADGSRAQQMALHTLKMMANGGIRDHVGQVRGAGPSPEGWGTGRPGGFDPCSPSRLSQGFHRYSTDRQWHVPHFEKMLYDQAQLTVAYSQGFQVTPARAQAPAPSGFSPHCLSPKLTLTLLRPRPPPGAPLYSHLPPP